MAKVYITHSIQKELKRHAKLLSEILNKIDKHLKGSKSLVDIYSPAKDLKVFKAYLSSGKIRAAILLRISKRIYIPFLIAKKESRDGWNLSKYSENLLCRRILKIQKEIEEGKFREYKL